jgi:hypothetical protein
MSYRCASHGMSHIGIPDNSEPCLVCDGCGVTRPVVRNGLNRYAWFTNRKPAPGWTARITDATRLDNCGECSKMAAELTKKGTLA